MKEFLRSFLASLFAFVFLVLLVAGIAGVAATRKPDIKKGSYLVVDIYGEILAYNPPDDIMAEIFGGAPETLQRILDNLEKSAVDKRIKGVIVKVSSNNTLGQASVQEIRRAIRKVRDAGKPVYAFSDAIDRKGLFVAAACDSIYMPLSGDVYFAGLGLITSYVKGTLDKLDIRPNIHKIDEYKAAAEMVTRTDMSPEARENRQWVVDDVWETFVAEFGEERGMDEERIVGLMAQTVFTAEQARDAGLIDRVTYWDGLTDMLKEGDDKQLRTVSQGRYARVERAKVGLKGKKKIAVVHAHGTIGGRKSRIDPMFGMMIGHETIRAELARVRRDDDIAAVVFRIDSPGGESLASDMISHEVESLAAKKPVVASMIDVAASGGYDIAYRATKIIADPMTITGSIGSIHGKMNVRGFYGKLGVTFDQLTRGPGALYWSPLRDFTEEERKRMEEYHWASFNIWLNDVAEHRGIALEELKKLAMGRIWTGNQAAANRLVDDVGGLDDALALAKELADIDADEDVTIVHYPKKKQLIEIITQGGAIKSALNWIAFRYLHEDLQGTIDFLTRGYFSGGGALPE